MNLPLVVPLDGSASAESALPVAAAIVRRTGAALHLISVEPGSATDWSVEPGMSRPSPAAQRRAAAGAYLGSVGVGLADADTGTIVTAQLEGPVVRAVVGYARAQAGLVVMAARGDGDPLRGPVGTVTDRVVRWSGLPVVVVPVARGQHRSAHWHCDRLLLVVDGSAPLDTLLDPFVELAAAFGAGVTVASATAAAQQPVRPLPGAFERGDGGDSGIDLVDAAVRRLRQAECPVEVRSVRGRLDARAILSLAAMLEVDLVAMACGDRPDGGLLRYGSAISGVLRRATLPVLVHCARSKVAGRPLGFGDRRGRGTPAPAA